MRTKPTIDLQSAPDKQREYSRERCVHEVVSLQASHSPDAEAVRAGGASLSYRNLASSANRLAQYLRSRGVGRDVVVGLCMERSIDQIVGALAILKAGGAYLPLDPACPERRLNLMLGDSRASVLVTEEHLAEKFVFGRWDVVKIDANDEIKRQPAEAPSTETSYKDLAYVIYTSGSTGAPKGVAIAHESLLNLIRWHQRAFEVTCHDRAAYMAGLGFDASVWESWPYLAAGASLYLADESIRNTPEFLRDWLVAQGITICFAATPLAERLITLSWPSNTALRILLTGADTLHRFPSPQLPFKLVNNYGPTECTVVATSGLVPAQGHSVGLPTIGTPIDNTSVYILDENLAAVPTGDTGELFVSGPGVARGYLNHPELTAERFLLNPFDPTPGARMYRTGDLARFLPDGQVAFVGRTDNQVKIRGFRIELDEITSLLNEDSTVEQSVAVARELAEGEKSLVAYVVAATGKTPNECRLKHALRSKLPDYMVPAIFVKLDSLPLLASGKIDRAALPAPSAANILKEESLVAPRTPLEERIAEILAPLLGLPEVGVEDNFFLLGGHSLLGTQLIARLRDTFGVDLSLRSIFNSPSVADLASEVERPLTIQIDGMDEEEVQRALSSENDGLLEGA